MYKVFLEKMKILPSEVDKQDLNLLIWIMLSNNEDKDLKDEDGAIMGLL